MYLKYALELQRPHCFMTSSSTPQRFASIAPHILKECGLKWPDISQNCKHFCRTKLRACEQSTVEMDVKLRIISFAYIYRKWIASC